MNICRSCKDLEGKMKICNTKIEPKQRFQDTMFTQDGKRLKNYPAWWIYKGEAYGDDVFFLLLNCALT